MTHPLDRPAWNALVSRWAPLAEGDGRALRLRPDHGPFAGAADASPGNLAALAALLPVDRPLWLVEAGDMPPPPGVALRQALCNQMVADAIAPRAAPGFEILSLGESDAGEMGALATLTEPGPFLENTHRLGEFVGVRQGGRLVAMAGERMKPTGFAEVSGVCTHPDFRGRGYAGALMRAVAQRILARGETPFLHVYATNAGAIALYESLGFVTRTQVVLSVIARS